MTSFIPVISAVILCGGISSLWREEGWGCFKDLASKTVDPLLKMITCAHVPELWFYRVACGC